MREIFDVCFWSSLLRLVFSGTLILAVPDVFAAGTFGLEQRPGGGPFLNGVVPDAAPAVPTGWEAVPAFPNLKFSDPVGMFPMPGTAKKLLVPEREGRIWIFDNDPAVTNKIKILDISDRVQGWADVGLLGVAFHPGFATNHYLFVYYVHPQQGVPALGGPGDPPPPIAWGAFNNRLSRFTLDENFKAKPDSELILVDQTGNGYTHHGGGMFFHPDNGFLYWTCGDDTIGLSQVINHSMLSGVFRIDVDMRGGNISHPIPKQPAGGTTANYYIPNDNPFVGEPYVLEEFFALGLRNPFRMTYDSVSKRIFISDVGNSTREELDVIEPEDPPALNFQWSFNEGFGPDLVPPFIGVNAPPILDYGHDEGNAIIGGYVYRGSKFAAELGGRYLFGDWATRNIYVLDETRSPAGKKILCTLPQAFSWNNTTGYPGLTSFGYDADHEIYFTVLGTYEGTVYKLAKTGASAVPKQFPALLSATGVFDDTANLKPSSQMLPYNVNSPLWSDGAVKSRWAAIPTDAVIGFNETNKWQFPVGSVFVKHFELPVDETSPLTSRRRLETRLLVCGTNGSVFGATYKWRADNSDADLLADKLDENIVIRTATGVRTQTWHYPSRNECLYCHSAVAGVLGASTRQLNGDFAYPSGVTDNQLRTWSHLGLFSNALDESAISGYHRVVPVTDTGSRLELRVRSYLDANCSHCHQPGGVPAGWDARFETPMAQTGIINGIPGSNLGLSGARIVAPGHPEQSVLYARVSTSDHTSQMPPVARNVVDTNAIKTLNEWITSLNPPGDTVAPPWFRDDISVVPMPGVASYRSNTLTISASGSGVSSIRDSFHFVYAPMSGDGEIITHVASIGNTAEWAQAGLMFRENISPGSPHACVLITPRGTPLFLARWIANEDTGIYQGANFPAPCWLKLNRTGDLIIGYISGDGVNWVQVFGLGVPMNKNLYAGFMVSSMAQTNLTAVFDSTQVKGGALPLNHAPTVVLTSPASDFDLLGLSSFSLAVDASDVDGSIARVDYYDDDTVVGASTQPPFGVLWTNITLGSHLISARAVDNLGAIATSPQILVNAKQALVETLGWNADGKTFHINFQAELGRTYIFEKSVDLVNWTLVSTNLATTSTVEIDGLNPVASRQFFRIVEPQ